MKLVIKKLKGKQAKFYSLLWGFNTDDNKPIIRGGVKPDEDNYEFDLNSLEIFKEGK